MVQPLAKRIFDEHVVDQPFPGTFAIRTDLVMCHEITTPPAILDIQEKHGDKVFDPTKIVAMIDHVSPANDSATALQGKVMREWVLRHGIKFFDVGRNGVCHALLPEQGFVLPGMTIVCGDSHTCTHGAFGALAVGIGTTDLEAAILKGIVFLREPKTMGIELKGVLPCGVYAKDVILYLISQIGVKGATDHVIEFTGSVIDVMDMESRMTICNMAVEAGATSGMCYPDSKTLYYYNGNLGAAAPEPEQFFQSLRTKWYFEKSVKYDSSHIFDLSELEPQVTFGDNPGQVKSVKEMAGTKVDQVYIGSCTNGRLSDLRIAARILYGKKIHESVRLIVAPATTKIQAEAISDGTAKSLINAGACFTNSTCGACLGMSCGVLAEGEVCASTTNRNFPGRMGKGGKVLLMSPATAAATALRGVITDSREVL